MTLLTIDQVNELDHPQFVDTFGFVFEGSPWVASSTWYARPFASAGHLHVSLCRSMRNATREQQIELIRSHPDLAGRAAIAGELTPESTREQASARLDQLTPDEFATFTRLNQTYREQFEFPFVICVREHTKESILANFIERLEHDRETEIETALEEICKIARLRLADVVTRVSSSEPSR
jgi:2-oxo-4-hydroxy-4-carboxy-5-ureidoimidazoline decarboxylase